MAKLTHEDEQVVYAAAQRFVDEGLRRDGSVFTPGRAIISGTNLASLHAAFNSQPDLSSQSFLEKFERQLEHVNDDVVQLAAEVIFVHLVVANDIKGATKRKTLTRVLSWMSEPVEVPAELDRALDRGLANTGIAFKTYRPHQLWFLIDFLREWKSLPNSEQKHLLADPQAFRTLAWSISMQAAYSQREALLHLVHPDYFEPIVSRDHKRLIAAAFARYAPPDAANVDAALAAIRKAITGESGPFESFYEEPIVSEWRPEAPEPAEEIGEDPGPEGRRAWVVRHNVWGVPRIDGWLEHGYAAIGWGELGEAPLHLRRSELSDLATEVYADDAPGAVRSSVGNVWRFVRDASPGDLVVTPNGSDVFVGVIASRARHVADDQESFRRDVEWANPRAPIRREELSEAAQSKLRSLLTVSDASDVAAEFARRAGLSDEAGKMSGEPVQLPQVDADFAHDVLLERAWLQEIVDLLAHKRQLIFYGPPGTGKTFLAQRLADLLTRGGGTSTLVQFHPSYTYEDFFEGFRPKVAASASGIAFELVPGPLKTIADRAREDPSNPYILIIDEINRANLAKVFGELYFLLEYRDRSLSLQYSPEEDFSLPPNLFLIGTMNTADRSIALVDAAMRRRFLFVPFFPQQPPIDGLLRRWLTREKLSDEPAVLLDALNETIDDPDFAVGPSYLMHRSVVTDGGLDRVWRHSIMPLLEEHYYGSKRNIHGEFGLAALRKRTNEADPDAPDATSDSESGTEDPGSPEP